MDNLDINSTMILSECPHCKSNNIIKHGSYKNRQRYKCKNCNKTFTSFTNKPWSYSKKPLIFWEKYAKVMECKFPLRLCSIILSINLKTAFSWRHKLMEYIENINNCKLSNTVGIIKTNIMENRKGKRNLIEKARCLNYIYAKDSKENFMLDISEKSKFTFNYVKNFLSKIVVPNTRILRTNNRIINIGVEKFIERKFSIIEDNLEDIIKSGIFKKNDQYRIWLKSFKGVATVFQNRYHHWFNNKYGIRNLLKKELAL